MMSCKWFVCKTVNILLIISGLSCDSREDGIQRESGSHPWNSSLPFTLQQRQENLSGASENQLSEGEMYFYKENQIQQLLGRPTGNLNSFSEDNTHFQGIHYFIAFLCCSLVIQNEELAQC